MANDHVDHNDVFIVHWLFEKNDVVNHYTNGTIIINVGWPVHNVKHV